MRRHPAALVAVVTFVVMSLSSGGCARSETLGYEEAIEVMVLDGVDRDRATCIVSALEGELPLAKVTGLDLGLDDAELTLLAATSARCAPTLVTGVGSFGGGATTDAAPDVAPAATTAPLDVDAAVYRMVDEGLDATLAGCLILAVDAQPDPRAVLDDPRHLSELIVDCRDGRS
jgi:hypothetical protein